MSAPPPFIDGATIARLLSPAAAVDALEAALRGGLDPEADTPRTSVRGDRGELLVMPSALAGPFGVKLVTVAPSGSPRIQGVFVLFDPRTLAPAALLDGIALTAVRTAAVSALAVRLLARANARRLLVFGAGVQARAHVEAVMAVRPIESVQVAARDPKRVQKLVEHCAALGLAAVAGDAVEDADVICCCTTAREPLFDGARVGADATVVAIGSHEPDAREVDERLVRAATVVVESRSAALRDAGDVIQAGLGADELTALAELVSGDATVPQDRPRLFKSVGMSWQDAVVAAAVAQRSS